MPDFAVSVSIRGDDQISDNLRRLSRNVDRFGKKAETSFALASRAAGAFKHVVGGILVSNAISAGFNALRQGASAAVQGFLDMDQALTSSAAKFNISALGAEKSALALQSLKDAARQVGATTEYTAAEAAQGLEFLAMAGFTTEQAIAALPTMVDLATASNTDFARSSVIAADALGAFGLASKDAQTQAQNLQRITDVFAQTAITTNVGTEDLYESMRMAAPIMTAAGQSLETFAAMAGVMGNAGIKGSLAGTALKNTIDNLINPVGRGAEMIEKLGLKTKDSKGNMRDLALILDDFAKKTENMGTAQRTAAISTVFGMYAVSGISAVLENGIPALVDFREGLGDAAGASKRMADEMRKSLTNRIKVLKSGLMELGFKVIEAFEQKFPGALDAAIKAVGEFDVTPIVEGIKSIVAFVKDAWNWFDKWKIAIFVLVAALAAFRVALALTSTVQLFIAIMTGATTITQAWAASQWAANAAMLANPVTWIILGVIALIAVLALVIVYWDDIKAAWNEAMASIAAGTNETTNNIAESLASVVTPVINAAIAITNAFGETWHAIKAGVAATVSAVIGAWGKLKGALGFDVSGLPTGDDVSKWFGTDIDYIPMSNASEADVAQSYKDAWGSAAEVMGAGTSPATGGSTPKAEAPNKAQREASQQSIDLRGVIDILAPEGMSAQASGTSSTNGKKAPGVDWRAKGGKN